VRLFPPDTWEERTWEVHHDGSHSLWVSCRYRTGVPSLFAVSPPVRARVQTIDEFDQFSGSNINRTCVQYFHRFRTYREALSWDDTAACVQIRPSAAEPGNRSSA
jgi:hypothetical protein